jgi:hypothetical protein
MFTKGFEKSAAKVAPKAAAKAAGGLGHELKKGMSSIGKHLKTNRKDYMMGGTAAGALGTAYGSNKKKK